MINYTRLADAFEFYHMAGYNKVEAPWQITKDVDNYTKPDDSEHLELSVNNGLVMVASAEQSFLQLRVDGKLPNGTYQAITPCFRDEPYDEWHQMMFMKLELINIGDTPFIEEDVLEIVNDAQTYFEYAGAKCSVIKTDESQFSYDIIHTPTGVELGSYGMRYHPDVGYWIYGTGIAEPRFSKALALVE